MSNYAVTFKKIVGFIIGLCLLLSAACIPYYNDVDDGYDYENVLKKEGKVKDEEADSIDVIFLGDSEAWAAFSPIQLYGEYGISSYNCGFPGQWIYDSTATLKKVLKYQHPSLVVLEPNMLFLSPNKYKVRLSRMFPIFHYHEFYKIDIDSYKSGKPKGANLSKVVNAYVGNADYMQQETTLHDFDQNNHEYIDEFVQLCKENDIQIVMVSSVSALNWTEGKHLAVSKWCQDNNIQYIDYNETDDFEKISFDWNTDTRDFGDHVNLSGSKKINTDLGSILQKTYALKDHRGDPEYAKWDSIYQDSSLYK